MFKLADSEKIGAYLLNQIHINQNFKSVRQFGKACLKESQKDINDEEARKMSNRLSQIINGKKSLQIYDLPIFTKLLNISCEELLSAGQCFTSTVNHLTNYAVAFSNDEKTWEEYINQNDRIILNADEYGKTVIDYALKFKNYDLLKYLMDKKYIWFVGEDKKDYFANFGAGTSIEKPSYFHPNLGILNIKMKEEHELRIQMILLAIEHKDLKILEKLRAREIPSLYQACYLSSTPADCEKYYDCRLIDAIANASDEIIQYFSEEFEIKDRINKTNRFLFPYISKLIGLLINNNHRCTESLLKKAISHNVYAYNKITQLLKNTVSAYDQEYLHCESVKNDIFKSIMRDIIFYDNGSIISYRDSGVKNGIITNIVQVTENSPDIKINNLIEKLNKTYVNIRDIKLEAL